MRRLGHHDECGESGFTLIELLIVILIIGILAAIAIPVFLNQRSKAYDAGIKSDLRNVADQMESYYSDFGAYPVTMAGVSFSGYTTLGTELVRVSTGNTIQVGFNASGDAYCLQGSNPRTTQATSWFYISSLGGLQPRGTAGCGTY